MSHRRTLITGITGQELSPHCRCHFAGPSEVFRDSVVAAGKAHTARNVAELADNALATLGWGLKTGFADLGRQMVMHNRAAASVLDRLPEQFRLVGMGE